VTVEITYAPDVAVPPRRFVPEGFDAADPAALEALAGTLVARPHRDVGELEQWLLDLAALACAVLAARTRRRIAMTRDTGNEAARTAHEAFERDVYPRWRRIQERFRKRFLESPFRAALPARYAMLDRALAAAAALYREENVPLLAEEEELGARYARMTGGRDVVFRGRRVRQEECAGLLEEPDRATRAEAYAALAIGRATDAEKTEALFDEMLALRHRIARNAGCRDYVEFRFRDLQRFDYGPADCAAFHAAVERHVVPALSAQMDARRRRLGLDSIRPYDRHAAGGRAPGRAFADEAGLLHVTRALLREIDPRFDDEFDILVRNGLLDLMARPGKAPGGYNSEVRDIRLPFIFANAVGRYTDVQTLLHEGGHAFHSLAMREEIVPELAHAPIEFCEVASMTMELFGLERFARVLPPDVARAAARQALERWLLRFSWIATIDAFQHWLYTHPGHRRDERRDAWEALRVRFEPYIDWSDLEEARATEWHAQLHLFRYAFYYIEYGIAAIGALRLWRRFRRDPGAAVARYRDALALGGSRPLPELFDTAGAPFAMDEKAMADAVAAIDEGLREAAG
jgi:oligoendopeptidase F